MQTRPELLALMPTRSEITSSLTAAGMTLAASPVDSCCLTNSRIQFSRIAPACFGKQQHHPLARVRLEERQISLNTSRWLEKLRRVCRLPAIPPSRTAFTCFEAFITEQLGARTIKSNIAVFATPDFRFTPPRQCRTIRARF